MIRICGVLSLLDVLWGCSQRRVLVGGVTMRCTAWQGRAPLQPTDVDTILMLAHRARIAVGKKVRFGGGRARAGPLAPLMGPFSIRDGMRKTDCIWYRDRRGMRVGLGRRPGNDG